MKISKKNWVTTTLGAVAIQQKTDIDRNSDAVDRYIAGEHMNSEDLHIRQWGIFNGQYLGPAFRRKFEKGDILYGSRRTYLKKVAVADFSGITANTTFVIKPNKEIIDPGLLPFLMLSDSFTEHSIKHSKGSVNPYINWKDIANYEFKIPPSIDDQKNIADLLWSIDSSIESYEQVVQKLRASLYVFLEHLIKKPSTNSVRLGGFVSVEKGLTYGSDDYGDDKTGEILINLKCFERFGGFNKGGIKFYKGEYENRHVLEPGELIIANTDITRDGNVVGYPVIVPDFGNKIVLFTMDVSRLKIKDNKKMLPAYLFYLLRTNWAHRYMFAHSPGTTVLHLDVSAVDDLPISNIDTGVQMDIVCKLNTIEENIKKLESLIKTSRIIQKQIINQIFR
jgi:restriction endonuclease S subunit